MINLFLFVFVFIIVYKIYLMKM